MDNSSIELLNNIFPLISYAIVRDCPPTWKLTETTLDFHNLMLIYGGEGIFYKDDVMFKVSKGDLIYYSPGETRKAYTSLTNPLKCCAVEFFYTCPSLDAGKWQLENCSLPFATSEKIHDEYLFRRLMDLFSELAELKLSINSISTVKLRITFSEILALLFQYKEGTQYSYSNIKKVDTIINYMIQNYTKPLTIKNLADYAEISPSYLGSIFKSITGKSVIDYLIHIRISQAKHFLKDGVTVSETAKNVGFNDIFYFSRAFKKYEGITPSQFCKSSI